MAMFFRLSSFPSHHPKIKHKSCRSASGSMNNQTAMVCYDFDNPIYQADEDDNEDCELPEEFSRLLG